MAHHLSTLQTALTRPGHLMGEPIPVPCRSPSSGEMFKAFQREQIARDMIQKRTGRTVSLCSSSSRVARLLSELDAQGKSGELRET